MIKTFPPTWKHLDALFDGDIGAMRREYSKMRDIAQKRIKRLKKSEFTITFEAYAEGVPKLSEFTDKKHGIREKGAFATELSRLSRFLASPGSSVQGRIKMRKESIKSLHKSGYTFVNEKNYKKFAAFMERYRALKLDSIYDSDEVLEEYFAVGEKKGVDPNELLDEFAEWVNSQGGLEEYAKNNKAPGGTSSAELKKLLGLS